jgi:Flp pilus assembly protein TadG
VTNLTDQRGSAAVEAVFLVPLVVVVLLAIVAGGRLVEAKADVHAATREAARAASLRGTPVGATAVAEQAVEDALARRRRSCTAWHATVDTSDLRPGGIVSVDVTCDVPLADLGLPGLPASRSVQARVAVPIDPQAVRP